MVITITLNPAIDKTIFISNFQLDKVNISEKIISCAGGKGINVSKGLKIFKKKSIAITCLGGLQGERLEKLIEQEELKSKIIWLQDETRVNTKIVDLENKTYTDLNEKGPQLTKGDIATLKNLITEIVSEEDILVLAGSIPRGVSNTIYKEIVEELNMPDIKVVMDTSGELLKSNISLHPWLIKPNIDELKALTNLPLESDVEIVDACKKILEQGVKNILVSLGEKGVIFVSHEGAYKAFSPKVEAKNTVGAGDTVVASFIYTDSKEMDIEEKLRFAVASGVAKVVLERGNPTLESIESHQKTVTVKKLN